MPRPYFRTPQLKQHTESTHTLPERLPKKRGESKMRAKLTLTAVLVTTVLVTISWPVDTAKCGGVVTDGLISYLDL